MDWQLGLLDSSAEDPVSVPTQKLRSHKLHSKLKKKKKAALECKQLDLLSTLLLAWNSDVMPRGTAAILQP